MLKISVLKVENPSCLWGRPIWGLSGDVETSELYKKLHFQMNLFYRGAKQDMRTLKPTSLEEGRVYVVYWAVKKSWCRAVVESIFVDSVSCQAWCFLVDHGEQVVVPSEQIRVAMENFLQLPFGVRRFHLAGIKPTTLRVSLLEEKAELKPSARWDSSATLFLHKLLQASTLKEAVLLEPESDSTPIKLYVTIGDIKICVNDDLVAKRFAYYSTNSTDGLEEGDRLPVMLSSSILTQSVSLVSNKPTAQTQPPSDQQCLVEAVGAADWLTAPSPPPQIVQHKLVKAGGEHRSVVTKQQLSPNSQSGSGSDAAKSSSSDDTDSSLAAALTKNLQLFRFLQFMKPGSSFEPAAPQEAEVLPLISNEKPEAENLQSCQAESLVDEEASSSSRSVASAPPEETQSSDWVCARLLELLNPQALNPDPDAEDAVVSPFDPCRSGILVHATFPVEPWISVNDPTIADTLCWVQRKQYSTLSPADCYSWPAVARGCHTLVISSSADQPLSYLTPLLTHIMLNSIFTSHTSSSGPIAVLLCPGWEKVQAVYDLLGVSKVSQKLYPTTVLLGIGKDEAKSVKIPKNCLLLVTTPFSLVRLLSCHCFLFLRLCHLVLDEADQLVSLAPDEMTTILQHFQVTSDKESDSCPPQLIVVAKRWTNHMEGLLSTYMPCPSIVISVPEEAALYGNVQQVILMTLEISKISVLLGTLSFSPDVGQKTLIVANSFQEVDDVFKAVSTRSVFCLKIHEGLTHDIDFVLEQWKKDIGPGTHVILVTTDDCLKGLDIRDATCVVHYSFPSSPKLFGSRLFCMAENFRNFSKRDQMRSSAVTRSVLLISERNARHVIGVLRYLERANALLPPELLTFAQGVQMANEDQKTDRHLCSHLKSFGVCRNNGICPERHRFISQLDQSKLPASGVIEVVPLYIKTASVFYGRVVEKEDGGFEKMASEMASYYAEKKLGAKKLLEGGLYAVQEDDVFHRVKLLSVPDRGDRLFFSVLVCFIDMGKEEEVKSHQILELPEQFHSLHEQAVEIVVCRVKPIDSETSWHPKVTRAISQKIRGLQHRARVVLSLGNTVFVDPMVRVTQIPGMKTVINEYNVQAEILKTGMGIRNQEHVDLLRALCEENSSSKDDGHVSRLADNITSLEDVRITAEEEVLANNFKAPDLSPLEAMRSGNQSLVPAPTDHLVPVCDQNSQSESEGGFGQRNTDKKSAEQMESTRDGDVFPSTSYTAALNLHEEGVQEGADQSTREQVISTSIRTGSDDASRSFHPLIRWYQTHDSAIVTMKLANPENQRCDFYSDRVIYSGSVNGRFYRADLELHYKIAADVCCWEMKSNEPVLKLVKQQPGPWDKLLRNKNIFVSYDMEHFDEGEAEDGVPNGPWFVENTGEDDWYGNSESSSESDDFL